MIPRPSRALAAALLVAAAASACGGSAHPRRVALPAGPQQMTATVDAVRLGVSGGCARNRVGGGLTDGRVVLTSASLVAGAGTVQVTNAQGKQVSGRVVALLAIGPLAAAGLVARKFPETSGQELADTAAAHLVPAEVAMAAGS